MQNDSPTPPPDDSSNSSNWLYFSLLGILVVVGAVGYVLYSRDPGNSPPRLEFPAVLEDDRQRAAICAQPHVLFRHTAPGTAHGRLMVAALNAADGPRYSTPLNCERVHGTAGTGVCLQSTPGVLPAYQCVNFDTNFQVVATFPQAGLPSRTRVSPDGRFAATTVFVTGDSYAGTGFSTRTTIYNLTSSTVIGELEFFDVRKNDQHFKVADFNFWGITFTHDGDLFYATLSTGGRIYLVEGRPSLRAIRVLREGVECPSLSPDGTRLVFKSRSTKGGQIVWGLRVLNLKTQAETTVNETRNVDDQCEWLDNEQVLYALTRAGGDGVSDVWAARADGSGSPRLFIPAATSPSVIRP